jgi:hypothetical protein
VEPDQPRPEEPEDRPFEPPDDIPAVSAEELVDGELAPEEPGPRRYPSTLGGAFYLLVLLGALVGIGMAATGDWRSGVRVVGGSLLFAALVRLVLSNEDAGMLAVRNKAIDATLLIGAGLLLVVLADSIPDQPS